jgi:putative adenylate-forming enzyme
MPTRTERWRALASFARARWGGQLRDRETLLAWQQAGLRGWLDRDLPRVSRYAGRAWERLDELPVVDKPALLASFDAFNVRGVGLDAALELARHAEDVHRSHPRRDDDLAFGLSSGTSGARSVFITSGAERATWMGILLARALSRELLKSVVFGAKPLRVALFLRANNRLYTTLKSRRIDFRFFGLDEGVEPHLTALAAALPDVLVAPASVLAWLAAQRANGRLDIQPRRIVSVAEVLEADDATAIEATFGLPVHQLYQCTEGFLGATCEAGTLHLNEDFVHVEYDWLDVERTRFAPIVTDFTRTTQIVARLKLDDVLRVKPGGCRCGSPLLAIESIEGRCDDVLWLPERAGGELRPIFPDTVRHAIAKRVEPIGDFHVTQRGSSLALATASSDPAAFDALRAALEPLFESHGLVTPTWTREGFVKRPPHAKRRRIRCASRP